jgi:hypothetical protein
MLDSGGQVLGAKAQIDYEQLSNGHLQLQRLHGYHPSGRALIVSGRGGLAGLSMDLEKNGQWT